MSRNFELLKRAEQERGVAATAVAAGMETETIRTVVPLPSETRATLPPIPADATLPAIGNDQAPEITKLVQRLFVLPGMGSPRVVLFSPVERGERADFVCARAAEFLATHVRGSVCVIDANVEAPTLDRYFSVPNDRGFTDMLHSNAPVSEFAHRVKDLDVTVITAGPHIREWESLLSADRLTNRMRELRSHFDYLLIDTAPVRKYASSLLLGHLADGVVLVVEAHDTRREIAVKAKEDWERGNTRLLGAVLNNRTFPIPDRVYAKL